MSEMEPQSAKKRPGSEFSGNIFSGLRTAIGILGSAGVLVLIGYIATVGHQTLLGISVRTPTIMDLSLTAGEFLLDSLLILLAQAATHYLLAVAVIVVGLALLLRDLFLPKRARHHTLLGWIVTLGAALSFAVALFEYELPSLGLRDALVGPDICSRALNDRNPFHQEGDWLWWQLVRYKGYQQGCRDLDLFATHHPEAALSPSESRAALEAMHAVSVLLLSIGFMALSMRIGSAASRVLQTARMATVGLFVLSALLLPYAYGKVIADTNARRGQMVIKPTSDLAIGLAIGLSANNSALGRKGVPNGLASALRPDTSLCPTDRCLDVYILGEDEKTLFVALFDKTLFSLYAWPKDGIDHYQIQAVVDVLAERITRGVPRS